MPPGLQLHSRSVVLGRPESDGAEVVEPRPRPGASLAPSARALALALFRVLAAVGFARAYPLSLGNWRGCGWRQIALDHIRSQHGPDGRDGGGR